MKRLLTILFTLFPLVAYAQPIGGGLIGGGSGSASAIQGRPVAPTAPADTNVLCWDAAAATWKPCAAGGAGAVATDTIWDAAGDLVQGTGANTAARLAHPGLANYFLYTNAADTIAWGYASTNMMTFLNSQMVIPATGSAFYLPAFTSANTMGQLAASGATGQYLRGATGAVPAWSTLTLPDTATAFKLAAYTATNVMTELAAVGATGTILRGATGAIPAWSTSTFADTYAIGTLLHASAANVVTGLGAGTTGQILTGVTGAAPAWASALTGTFTFGQAAGAGAGYIKFLEDPDHGTNTATLIGPHSTADVVITLPATTGTVALAGTERLATFGWDGGAAAITVGATSKRCTNIPFAATITGWTLTNQQADTLSTAIYLDTFSVDAIATTSITGTAPIRTAAKVAATSTTLTGWTTAVTANDSICAMVTTCGLATWANVVIWGTK